mmetsp:Transcript_11109/g.15416  ORF Transcript_11109/g.15416 Transcript_11109/m.15416 type:complete len:270 (-) Transcript_11109:89-898(-)
MGSKTVLRSRPRSVEEVLGNHDIIMQVFKFLGPSAKILVRLRRTCQTFKHVVDKAKETLWEQAFKLNPNFEVDSLDLYQPKWIMRYKGHTILGRGWVKALDLLVHFLVVTSKPIALTDEKWFNEFVPRLHPLSRFWNFYSSTPSLPKALQKRDHQQKFHDLLMVQTKLKNLIEIMQSYCNVFQKNYVFTKCGCSGYDCPKVRSIRAYIVYQIRQIDTLSVIEARRVLHEAILDEYAQTSNITHDENCSKQHTIVQGQPIHGMYMQSRDW